MLDALANMVTLTAWYICSVLCLFLAQKLICWSVTNRIVLWIFLFETISYCSCLEVKVSLVHCHVYASVAKFSRRPIFKYIAWVRRQNWRLADWCCTLLYILGNIHVCLDDNICYVGMCCKSYSIVYMICWWIIVLAIIRCEARNYEICVVAIVFIARLNNTLGLFLLLSCLIH